MATWRKLVALTFMGAALATACEIGDPDDDEDDVFDDDNVAGSGNKAGQATAGKAGSGVGGSAAGAGGSTAGRGGAGAGGTPTAGTGNAGTGGTDDGIPDDLTCGEGQGTEPFESDCDDFADFDARYATCLSCLGASCCEELGQCYATNPSTSCGYAAVDERGNPEYLCVIECLAKAIEDDGFYDEAAETECAFTCGTTKDGQGNACATVLIADSTNAVVNCMHNNCETDCVEDLVGKP